MDTKKFQFTNTVWLWQTDKGGWHFVSVPKDLSQRIYTDFNYLNQGWGSIAVDVKIGQTDFSTSIFWSKENEQYLLPLKAVVRKKEKIFEGSQINVSLTIKYAL